MIIESSSGLLNGYQLELNYALVDRHSLDVSPVVGEILTMQCDERVREFADGDSVWSLSGPCHRLSVRSRSGFESIDDARVFFSKETAMAVERAGELGVRLVGMGMHPWMQVNEIELWQYADNRRDVALQQLFGTARHGYGNQQCIRLSLPFTTEGDFQRLFAALRFALPIVPALAASSPFTNGRRGIAKNCRLAARRDYVGTMAEFCSSIVPEYYSCRADMKARRTSYLEGVLGDRGLVNALPVSDVCGNGLWADFDTGLIHIQVLDMQECLSANLAMCAFAVALVRVLMREENVPFKVQSGWPSGRLNEILEPIVLDAETGIVRDREYLSFFGFPEKGKARMSELLQFLVEDKLADDELIRGNQSIFRVLVEHGSLATRCLTALSEDWDREELYQVYLRLVDCQSNDEVLGASSA